MMQGEIVSIFKDFYFEIKHFNAMIKKNRIITKKKKKIFKQMSLVFLQKIQGIKYQNLRKID